jgi:carbamoyltransferase
MKILGISAFYHDSAAAVLKDGEIVAAAQEERFSRIKNDPAFPAAAIRYCLSESGIGMDELDAVVFYDKPFLKFERLLETYYAYAPAGWLSFLRAMPVWIKEKLFLKKILYRELGKIGERAKKGQRSKKRPLLLFPEHHLSHAASAYYPSAFNEAAILTLDGVGEWATVSISKGEGKRITIMKELDFPHSLGLLYSAFTYYCGFAVNSGEYKLMGLAPYGDRNGEDCRRMVELITTKLVDVREDGSIFLHQEYFDYATGSRMVRDRAWESLFGFGRRAEDGPLEQRYCDMALAIQEVTEEIVLRLASEAKRITGLDKLCMAGGVALNCVANGRLQALGLFSDIFIQPAAGDAGGALGAAYAAHHIYFDMDRKEELPFPDGMKGSYLGPEFGETDILPVARKYGLVWSKMDGLASLVEETARLIAGGHVIGWFQGRMEFGPRALGCRSILADPRNPEMQKKLNLSIKNREGFRPFAPAVLAEAVQEYFEGEGPSPYMLLVRQVKKSRQLGLPADYATRSWVDKLYYQRSDLPAITHVDYSARIQTVDRQTNPRFWQLLNAFREQTGCSVLINTSFNVRDEPIVHTPEDAIRCFLQTQMDYLVMGDLIFSKNAYIARTKSRSDGFPEGPLEFSESA